MVIDSRVLLTGRWKLDISVVTAACLDIYHGPWLAQGR